MYLAGQNRDIKSFWTENYILSDILFCNKNLKSGFEMSVESNL